MPTPAGVASGGGDPGDSGDDGDDGDNAGEESSRKSEQSRPDESERPAGTVFLVDFAKLLILLLWGASSPVTPPAGPRGSPAEGSA
jgi:hypothetical protein